jgi:hypothetical protein
LVIFSSLHLWSRLFPRKACAPISKMDRSLYKKTFKLRIDIFHVWKSAFILRNRRIPNSPV